jgi:hypothetical protein
MPSKAINNDGNNNDLTSNREEEKPQLVENRQSNTNCPTVTPVSNLGQTIDIEIFSFG